MTETWDSLGWISHHNGLWYEYGKAERGVFLNKMAEISGQLKDLSNAEKCISIMKLENENIVDHLCKYIKTIINTWGES